MCSACSGDYENPEPIEPEQEAEIAAQQVADEAALRVARGSIKDSKMLIERALGVKLG